MATSGLRPRRVALALVSLQILALCVAHPHKKHSCPSRLHLAIGVYTYQSWLPTSAGRGVTIASLTRNSLVTSRVISNTTTGENPSYCASGRNRALYCVNENSEGTLTKLYGYKTPIKSSSAPTGAGGSTHLAVLPVRARNGGERVIVANYGGAVTSFVVGDNTKVVTHIIPPEFAATKSGEQSEPHPHMILPLGNGDVAVPDLGSDIVWRFGVGSNGELWRKRGLKMRKGDGPRHAVRGRHDNVYVVNEISNSVARIRGCTPHGVFRECERKVLIDGVSKNVNGYSAAAIRVSKDYKFLYASVRLPDTEYGKIVVFRLNRHGAIGRRVGIYSSQGVHPRDLSIIERAPDCKSYIAVVNRDSDNLLLMERNRYTGAISADVRYKLAVNTPTSVLPGVRF